jgi:hypothetical protein
MWGQGSYWAAKQSALWASAPAPAPAPTRTAISVATLADHELQFGRAAVRVIEYSDAESTNTNRLT